MHLPDARTEGLQPLRAYSAGCACLRCTGCTRYNMTVEAGKTYRVRLINAGSLAFLSVCFADHSVTVVAADAYPIDPFVAKCVDINLGQRCALVLTCQGSAFHALFTAQPEEPLLHFMAEEGRRRAFFTIHCSSACSCSHLLQKFQEPAICLCSIAARCPVLRCISFPAAQHAKVRTSTPITWAVLNADLARMLPEQVRRAAEGRPTREQLLAVGRRRQQHAHRLAGRLRRAALRGRE